MNARFEFNGNFFEIRRFKYYPEYSAYNIVFELCVKNGAFSGNCGFESHMYEFERFVSGLEEMNRFERESVRFGDVSGMSEVLFRLDRTGHITVFGKASDSENTLEFELNADQTVLPGFIAGLKELF